MPRLSNLFRNNAELSATKKESSSKSSRGGIFRVKHPLIKRSKNQQLSSTIKNAVPESASRGPIEQSITWTLSEDSASPTKVSQNTYEPVEPEVEQTQALVFTEQDLILNELNHIQALSNLEANVHLLKTTMDNLVAKHAAEIEKKDEEYVEMLIKLGEKEEELAAVRAELSEAKRDLSIVSSTLVQTQHLYFEERHKSIFRAFMN